jgi:lysozyme family protein
MLNLIHIPSDDDILRMILIHEGIDGEYTNDPADSGGPTRWGITRAVLALHRGVPLEQISALDIQVLERWESEDIFRARFIRPFAGIADPIRINVIDMGVNAGPPRATILLQQTIGAGVDGQIGFETIRLSKARDWNDLYVGVRLAFYEGLIARAPKNLKWRNGWRNRALNFDSKRATPRTLFSPEPIFEFVGKAYDDEAA